MNDKCGKDLAVSIRDRLLNLARERGEDFQLILTQYGVYLQRKLNQKQYTFAFQMTPAAEVQLFDSIAPSRINTGQF